MKFSRKALLIAVLACTAQVHAAPVVVQFSGKVDICAWFGGEVCLSQDTSDATGFEIARGESFSGTFSYDDAAVLDRTSPSGPWTGSGNFTMSLTFANGTVSPDFGNSIDYYDNNPNSSRPGDSIYARGATDASWQTRLLIQFLNPGSTTVNNGTFPPASEWQQYPGGRSFFSLDATANDLDYVYTGVIDRFSVISSVPEPASFALLLAGLPLVLRRKAAAAS